MPTQEERLVQVEQALRDISHNETILLGMAVKHEELLREMRTRLTRLEQKLTEHDQRFEAIDKRFEAIDKRFDRLEALVMQILARLPEPQ